MTNIRYELVCAEFALDIVQWWAEVSSCHIGRWSLFFLLKNTHQPYVNFLPAHECYLTKKSVFGKLILRVEESDEAGRFLVATRDIRKGEVPNIFKESAITNINILSTSLSLTLQKGGVIWSPSGCRTHLHTDSACLSWVPEVVQVLVEMLRVSQPADHFQCHKHYKQVARPCHQRQVPRVWIASLWRSVPGRVVAQVRTTSHLLLVQIRLTFSFWASELAEL